MGELTAVNSSDEEIRQRLRFTLKTRKTLSQKSREAKKDQQWEQRETSQRVKIRQKKKKTKKKKPEVAPPGFEPVPQLPLVQKERPQTTGPSYRLGTVWFLKLIILKYFSLPFTLFERCEAVFIMNSKIHFGKNSLNEYFKTISHYLRVYSLSGFT